MIARVRNWQNTAMVGQPNVVYYRSYPGNDHTCRPGTGLCSSESSMASRPKGDKVRSNKHMHPMNPSARGVSVKWPKETRGDREC
jgi:hypothetical protein